MKATSGEQLLPLTGEANQKRVTITFDGGTPCNVPSRGYGIGYGSFKVGADPIVRVSHRRPMSANSAEILTLVEAVRYVVRTRGRGWHLEILGDSQIALKWARGTTERGKPAKLSKGTSPEFRQAIQTLRDVLEGFKVSATWHPRDRSVALFGH